MTKSLRREFSAVILGGGAAGLYLAYRLMALGRLSGSVAVLERQPYCGGLARSFEVDGLWFDLGSHRLHPSIDPQILADIKGQLGDDLLMRPRNGRICIANRMVKFPLRIGDLTRRLPTRVVAGIVRDLIMKPLAPRSAEGGTFESELLAGIGPTVCHNFYFPYARKLWGLQPNQIDAIQARKRVSANSTLKILRKIADFVVGRRKAGQVFYYPRYGFGQIVQALERKVVEMGGEIFTGQQVTAIRAAQDASWEIVSSAPDRNEIRLRSATVFSTIPAPVLTRLHGDLVPLEVQSAAAGLSYRGMIFAYFIFARNQFTIFDAHYFPGENVIFSRLSEPRNYTDRNQPENLTGLCAEIPCSPGDAIWTMPETTLLDRVTRDLAVVGLALPKTLAKRFLRREAHVYPIYNREFSERMAKIDGFLSSLDGVVSVGRQALFMHDNTHHTMEMALRAADCLMGEGHFDGVRWRRYREAFENNVVED